MQIILTSLSALFPERYMTLRFYDEFQFYPRWKQYTYIEIVIPLGTWKFEQSYYYNRGV